MSDHGRGGLLVRWYRRWSGALIGYAVAWTGGDLHLAEELVDEAFHEMFRRWDQLVEFDDRSRYGWLRAVVRNRAVDSYRRRCGMVVLVDPVNDGARLDRASLPDSPDDPVQALLDAERGVLARELLDRCMAVIQTMHEQWRVAILLRGDGYTSRQIGERLGLDASTVRGYWKQAIEELLASVGDVVTILEEGDLQGRGGGRGDDH